MYEKLFSPGQIGSLRLRNRIIRSAAFEGMCPGHHVSDELIRYHTDVAAGGVAMTTVAYASVAPSGLSFPHQLLLAPEEVPGLRRLTDAIHREGAAASVQIGHCGQMANVKYSGDCISPSGGFNLYGPTWPRAMSLSDIQAVIRHFGLAAVLAVESGFDAIEVHAGHGYLISQFLSPHTNRRKDIYGESFENRCRFMVEVIREVRQKAGSGMALVVKMNLRDGFRGGMELDESIEVARLLEKEGADALVLSGGFVSKAPMYVMRGAMPVDAMSKYMNNPWMRLGTRLFGRFLMKPYPFSEAYFLDDALKVRARVRLPLIFVGGLKSGKVMEEILVHGFDFLQVARALIQDPAFVNKLRYGEMQVSGCQSSNFCIAHMYSGKMVCFQHHPDVPVKWKERYIKKGSGLL